MNILAIDIGTQSIRAGIVDINGTILAVSQQLQEVYNPQPGWAQQKPEAWWTLTKQVISDVLKISKVDLNSIKGIAVCGQMHGPVGIDETGETTTDWTQIWMDKRCENICNIIRQNYDESELSKITGNPVTTGWSGIKIKWIKENQPEIYEKTKWFLVPKDFINYQLTGVAATDPSEASGTYLYDVSTNNYSRYLAEVLDLDLNKFAPIKNSYDVIGTIRKDISNKFGLPVNTPVIAGGGDFIVSLLGLGLVSEGTAVDMTGTSTLFVVQKDKPIVHPAVQNLRHVVDGWIPFTILDTGGLSMKWCKDFLNSANSSEISYAQMIEMAENIPCGSEGVIFYPYLLGERRQDNVFAKGCFFGLTLRHKAAHIARSVMEGVALALGKDIQTFKKIGVNINQVLCVGGATRNKLLYQIKADITQIPHIITDEPEASLRGCGLLAAFGLRIIERFNYNILSDNLKYTIIEPNKDKAAQYKKTQSEFNRMYDRFIGFWKE
ncbi:MAG: FGGY-family carbohydrate kinase [Candidatus Hermodarchaeota archaeon]